MFERHILNEPIIRISRAFWGDYEPELIWASKKNCSGNFLKKLYRDWCSSCDLCNHGLPANINGMVLLAVKKKREPCVFCSLETVLGTSLENRIKSCYLSFLFLELHNRTKRLMDMSLRPEITAQPQIPNPN